MVICGKTFDAGTAGTDTGESEIEAVISDMHLSEGATLRRVRRPNLLVRIVRAITRRETESVYDEVPNPLEDFPDDGVFASFIDRFVAKYGDAGLLRLRLLGDTFDFLAVSWQGTLEDPPFETVAAAKMKRIIAGHPGFFDALAGFLARPDVRLDFFVGNHDMHLAWPKVQQIIRRRLCGRDVGLNARLRFIDQQSGFREIYRGVLYDHGMNAELNNYCDPKNTILHDRLGVRLKRPILNEPFGNYMARLAHEIKLRNQLIGRVPNERDIWIHALKFNLSWSAFAIAAFFWALIYNQFFAFWDVRRKTGIVTAVRVLLATTNKNPVDGWMIRQAAKLGLRVSISGHSHGEIRTTDSDHTHINTGAWAKKLKLVWPVFPKRWKRWPWLESAWRAAGHFFRTGELRRARLILKVIVYLSVVAVLTVVLWTTFPQRAPRFLGWHPNEFKAYVGIGLVVLLAIGIYRFFVVQPDTVPAMRYTFALVQHGPGDALNVELMEYDHKNGSFREYV